LSVTCTFARLDFYIALVTKNGIRNIQNGKRGLLKMFCHPPHCQRNPISKLPKSSV
jgi:hypothetical protein